jgi:hypothetical protein
MITPGGLTAGIAHLAELCAEQGSTEIPAAAVGGSVLLGTDLPRNALDAHIAGLIDGYRIPAEVAAELPLAGPPAAVAERLQCYAAAGARQIILGLIGNNWRRQCDLLAEAARLT